MVAFAISFWPLQFVGSPLHAEQCAIGVDLIAQDSAHSRYVLAGHLGVRHVLDSMRACKLSKLSTEFAAPQHHVHNYSHGAACDIDKRVFINSLLSSSADHY
jgi:hypothetical protein